MKKILQITFFFYLSLSVNSQTITTLTANGTGNTYEEINAVLAPGATGEGAIEAPGITPTDDCTNHDDFENGEETNENRHIQEVYDEILDEYVFKFSLHVDEDIDRDICTTTDRQRNEIKTYGSSPDYLLGVLGETVEYKWKFKLAEDFQASPRFTHIHQLKSVGGIEDEESIPMITFTIYYEEDIDASILEIRYSETTFQSTISETLDTNNNIEIDNTNILLSELTGNWIEVTETITYGFENDGSYQVSMVNIETDEVLMDYFDDTRSYYKIGADFLRPKWGIYRSTEDSEDLRDEEVLYADFSITEWTNDALSNENFEDLENLRKLAFYPNPCKNIIYFPFSFEEANNFYIEIISANGSKVISKKLTSNELYITNLSTGFYFIKITNTTSNTYSIKKLLKRK